MPDAADITPPPRCTYCGAELTSGTVTYSNTTYRSRDHRGKAIVKTDRLPYCKDKPCAGHDQMAREG